MASLAEAEHLSNRFLADPYIENPLSDVTVLPSQNFSFTLQEVFEDPDGDTLTYSASLEGSNLPD